MDDMTYRHVGTSGLRVSAVGLGCNYFGARTNAEQSKKIVHAALDVGINFFDTANIYGEGASEKCLGSALAGRRDRAVIATKWGRSQTGGPNDAGASRALVMRQVEESLRRLDTDYIDLYQLHFPDTSTPIEETLSALDDLVRVGKVRYIGSSNMAAWQLVDAHWTARTNGWARFVANQTRYSLLERQAEREIVPACQQFGVGLIPWLALAGGLLSGKYRRDDPGPPGGRLSSEPGEGHPRTRLEEVASLRSPANFEAVEALTDFADARGLTLLHVALGGLAAKPAVASVLAGASSPEQVLANAAAGTWQPTSEDLATVDRLTESLGNPCH